MIIEKEIVKDCQQFLQTFENQVRGKNIKFDNFCYVWKKLGFNYIYSVQKNDEDIAKTTKVAMIYANSNIKNGVSVDRQIGALYLLYALYYKQPTKKFEKINVTIDCWKALKKLDQLLNSIEYGNEPKYIFLKLKMDKAFRFVLSEYYYAFEKFLSPEVLLDSNNPSQTHLKYVLENDLNYLQNNKTGYLPVMGKLQEKYNESKAKLNLKYEGNEPQYVSLQPLNIINDLKKSMSKITEILHKNLEDDENEDVKPTSMELQRYKTKKKAMRFSEVKSF